jgi:hypothetical protein
VGVVFLRFEVVEPRVLQATRDRLVDQSWRLMSAVCADRSYSRDPLSTTVLVGSREITLLIQLSCENPPRLLQLADEEALLVHVVDIVSTYCCDLASHMLEGSMDPHDHVTCTETRMF